MCLPYDLSNVLFITTCNITETIPPALLDRVEAIELPGYIPDEKVKIAQNFLLPRQIKENGLEPNEVSFSESALYKIIREYTMESGVRNLEREIASILRKIAREKAENNQVKKKITSKNVHVYLGQPKVKADNLLKGSSDPGVATGLAWTPYGGVVLLVEAVIAESGGFLKKTGMLGEVMDQSIELAITYLRTMQNKLEISEEIRNKKLLNGESSKSSRGIHVHVPEGATPKDGPSAGITIFFALLSEFIQKPIRQNIAMTGELTLKGRITEIGGLKEKVLAAVNNGIKTVIIPKGNKRDLEEIPANIRNKVEFKLVEKIDKELINFVFNENVFKENEIA